VAARCPRNLHGLELRDKQSRYHAACLSAFGFVYNKLVLKRAGLPAPREWEDLGRPEFQGLGSSGDPTLSGSVHVAHGRLGRARDGSAAGARWRGYLQRAGLQRRRLLGPARRLLGGGSGACIDFSPLRLSAARARRICSLSFPVRESVSRRIASRFARPAQPRGGPAAFMAFVLSEAGQKLWYQPRGTEGGPVEYDLERLPVLERDFEVGAAPFHKFFGMTGSRSRSYSTGPPLRAAR